MPSESELKPDMTRKSLDCTCDTKVHVNVVQNGDWINAYCTKCSAAITVHIDAGGRDFLVAKSPVSENESAIRFEATELEAT